MRPIRRGESGPAVEDIQRRLRLLGYDLGRAGIDGIFQGATAEAVLAFQHKLGLAEDGFVGDETWSALVDSTFTLGDRMLYLRLPHFHGSDVGVLQQALNVLGFACGEHDSIFGAYTERAVREFQRNSGLVADGIVGPETVKALLALRHAWEGKDPKAHSQAVLASARAAEVLGQVALVVSGLDETGLRVAGRLVNLAMATNPDSKISIVDAGNARAEASIHHAALVVMLTASDADTHSQQPVVKLDGQGLSSRLGAAVAASSDDCPAVTIQFGAPVAYDEREEQRAAVALLDAVCVVYA